LRAGRCCRAPHGALQTKGSECALLLAHSSCALLRFEEDLRLSMNPGFSALE
jgi:hypothetical protein